MKVQPPSADLLIARPTNLRSQILCFGIVGTIGFIVNAGVLVGLAHSIGPFWAQCLAFPVAASVTWYLNRRYTFGASRHAWHREWLRYISSNIVGWLVNNGVYLFLILKFSLAYAHPTLALAVGAIAGLIFNFLGSKWIVFN